MRSGIVGFIRNDEGQDLIEYGLLAGIITAAVVLLITSISGKVLALFTSLDSAIKTPTPAP
jgi:pilus assembly protein Flp/PilA